MTCGKMARTKNKEMTLKVIQIGNSIGVILPKKDYEFRDAKPYVDWVKLEFKGFVR